METVGAIMVILAVLGTPTAIFVWVASSIMEYRSGLSAGRTGRSYNNDSRFCAWAYERGYARGLIEGEGFTRKGLNAKKYGRD